MRYRAFRTKKDNQFYFQFMTDGGDLVMKSQAYASKADCFNGIRSVMENASNPDRYETVPGDGGTFAFKLKAGNNAEIGRSVNYSSEEGLNNMIALFRTQAPTANSGEAKAAETSKPEAVKTASTKGGAGGSSTDDDYRPLAFYQSRISGVENGFDTFTDTDKNEHYFTYNMEGKIILISEGYNSEASRDNGIKSVTKNMTNPGRYKRGIHKNGKHFFGLRAGNNQELGTSRWCDTEEEMNAFINGLLSGGSTKSAAKAKSSKKPKSSSTKKTKVKAAKPERTYLAKNGKYPCSQITYDTFKSGGNDRYYFVFKSKADKAVLINGDVRGFETEDELNRGVDKVMMLAPNPDNYFRKASKNGKHYFYVVDGDKNIARGSLFYNEEEDMEETIKMIACGAGMVKASAPALATAGKDEYLSSEAYTGETGFHTFEKDGKYYFSYNEGNGKAQLRSQGYSSESARDNGIESVKKNAPIEDRWNASEDGGKYYYALKAGNHQEIARSSPYASPVERNKAYASAYGAFREKPEVIAASALAASAAGRDDYLTCESYTGETGFHSFEKEGKYYFSYNGANGKAQLCSQGYSSESARDNGIESVKKNAPIEDRWNASEDGGKYYYALKAGNHQEIARSCPYGSLVDRNKAYASAYDAFREKPKVIAASAPVAATSKDEYLPCEAYAGTNEGFHSFTSKTNGEHFFSYNDKSGQVLLRSEGYSSESARDNGIESVKKNASIEKRWSTGVENGQHYYALKAGNHQEIARSCYFDSEEEMNRAYNLVTYALADKPDVVESIAASPPPVPEVVKAAAIAPTPPPAPKAPKVEKIADDYMPCEAYLGAAGFHSFFDDNRKEYFFAYNDEDGNTLLRSEGYKTANARDNGIESVKKNASIEGRWKKETALNGKYHYYVLRAGNNQEIARSCYYEDREQMNTNFMMLGGAFAPVLASKLTSSSEKVTATPPPPPPKPKEKEDDYLRCKEYANRKVNDKVNNVALFKHENGQYYFAVYNEDGSVRLRSEGFRNAKDRDSELSATLKNMNKEEMYETIEKGNYYINILRDETGREVARSCMQKEKVAVIPPAILAGGLAAGLAGLGAAGGKAGEKEKAAVVPPVVVPPVVPADAPPVVVPPAVVPPPKPKTVKEKAAAAAAGAAAAVPVAAAAYAGTGGTGEKKKGGFAWWWLLPLLLLALLLIFLLRGCDGCAKKAPVVPPPTVIDTSEQVTPPPPVKIALCPAAGDLKLAAGSGANVAEYLSDPESDYPKRFTFDNVGFSRNRARLNTAARKALDDLAVCMIGCENTNVDIYGYITDKENSSYRGSKEVSLDDARARSVYDYLKTRGIDGSRMSFQGEGTGDNNNIVIQIDD